MKIIHVCHQYTPAIGGCQVYMKELSETLVRMGDDVTIFVPQALNGLRFKEENPDGDKLPVTQNIDGVNVQRFPIQYDLYNKIFERLPKLKGGSRIVSLFFKDAMEAIKRGPFIPKMIFKIRNLKPDIVAVLNAYNTHAYFCYLAKKWFKIPLVVMPSLRMEPVWVDDPMVDKILRISDLVIAFTEFEKDIILKKGVEADKVKVIGNGTNPKEFTGIDAKGFKQKYKIKDNELTVSFLARKAKGKGVEILIDAMKEVWKEKENVRLVLAGQNQDNHQEIQRKIDSLDSDDKPKVVEIDEVPPATRHEIYAACDVFVIVSEIDSFGIAYLEAWASGKPVIAARNTAPGSYIKDGLDGLLVEYGNAKELAEALLKLLNNKDLREDMGNKGRNRIKEDFNWETITHKIRDEYQTLLRNTKHKTHENK